MQSKGRKIENGSASAILWSCLAPVPNICDATCVCLLLLSVPIHSRKCFFFSPNNGIENVESELSNCSFINYFSELMVANSQLYAKISYCDFWCCCRFDFGKLPFLLSVKATSSPLKRESVYCAS